MRLVLTLSTGYGIYSVISHEGRFYALCGGHSGARMRVRVCDLTGARQWDFSEVCTSSQWINFHVAPDRGLCVAISEQVAVCLETGERFDIALGPCPGFDDYRLRQAWVANRNKCIVGTRFDRFATTDTHVFMTGSAAKSLGDIAMGPTQFKKVVAVKGIGSGKVVSYRRGGEARVMRLPDSKHNPVHMVGADDGLTFLAVCRQAIYQIDADVE